MALSGDRVRKYKSLFFFFVAQNVFFFIPPCPVSIFARLLHVVCHFAVIFQTSHRVPPFIVVCLLHAIFCYDDGDDDDTAVDNLSSPRLVPPSAPPSPRRGPSAFSRYYSDGVFSATPRTRAPVHANATYVPDRDAHMAAVRFPG